MKDEHKESFWKPKITGKKGINDMSILTIWTLFLFFSSVFIVFVNEEFNTNAPNFNNDKFSVSAIQDSDDVSSFSPARILSTMLGLATFNVTNSLNLPFWIVSFYSVLSILMIVLLAKNFIPFIGGG
ncbi:hypothetical protein KAR91_67820 [Candidatus Pacearchaeota archaeon]|nr:hypothetical protein [Candidatus Pacearchaeota archaeon]